jgi:hypothetical protein
MTHELNHVSSPDQAGLKTLDKPGFLTPSQLAVAHKVSAGVLACEFQHRLGARHTPHNSRPFWRAGQAKRDTAFGTPVPTGSHYTKPLPSSPPAPLLPVLTISTLAHPFSLRFPHSTAPARSARVQLLPPRQGRVQSRLRLLPTPKNHPKIPVMSRIVAYRKNFPSIEPLSNQPKERI